MPAQIMDEDTYMYVDSGIELRPATAFGRPVVHNHRHNLKNRFELLKTLGEGTYGKVKLAIDKESHEEVAIKFIKKTKIQDETELNRLRREIRILSSLNHPHIVNVREVFENKDKIILVMDCATGGELYDYINDKHRLSEIEARRLFRQIISAVHYCHQHGIVHRDLKLENIVMDHEGNIKIADFGLSNYFGGDKLLSTYCGSPLYASPEIVNGRPYKGPEVDCWSLGVVLYTIVYGNMPFDSSDFKVLRKQISSGDYYEPACPSEAAGLIRHLLTVNAEKRATMNDALSHWWVNLGFKETPCGQTYPHSDMLKPSHTQHSLSSDSEGEVESRKLKGILKKPKTSDGSAASNESTCETDLSSSSTHLKHKSPFHPLPHDNHSVNNTPVGSPTGEAEEVFCSANLDQSLDRNGAPRGESAKKIFDSEKKPARSILKRRGKFSGGDSGCILNESGNKSPGVDSKETNLVYNLSDIETALCSEGPTLHQMCHAERADIVCQRSSVTMETTSITVVPRRSILKKPGQSDARKRLSACSTGSNSSADVLDFSYDSDDSFLNLAQFDINMNGNSATEDTSKNNFLEIPITQRVRRKPRAYKSIFGNSDFSGDIGQAELQEIYKQALSVCPK